MLDSSSLPDSNSSMVAFVQSLDSTMAGTVGVVDLAVADKLLGSSKTGGKKQKLV